MPPKKTGPKGIVRPLHGIPKAKHTNILKLIRHFVASDMYIPTGHARKRLDQRDVTIMELRAALLNGKRVPADDRYHFHDEKGNKIERWSYAIEHRGWDRTLKVCVSINSKSPKPLLIVTIIIKD